MKNILITLILFCFININLSQNNDTINAAIDTNLSSKPVKSKGLGVAVSPSSMRFNVAVGKKQVKYLYITNDTEKPYAFKITFDNVDMDSEGKVGPANNSNYEYGLTKWISASPNFIELEPFEKAKVEITVNVPDNEVNHHAAWCIGMVDQVTERKTIETNESDLMSLGVIPSFGFGVYFYQNPPDLKVNQVEIMDFTFNYDEKNKYISLVAKNIGNGISRSKVYIELNELKTGYYEKLDLKVFNILPGRSRNFNFVLPGTMPKGRYSIMGVLDFGSDEEVKAASKEIIIE